MECPNLTEEQSVSAVCTKYFHVFVVEFSNAKIVSVCVRFVTSVISFIFL